MLTHADRLTFGFVPEQRGLYLKMRVRDQLAYLARLHGLTAGHAAGACDRWLRRLGIGASWAFWCPSANPARGAAAMTGAHPAGLSIPTRAGAASLMREEEAMSNRIGGTAEPGQVISLTQRSALHRDYELRAADRALGSLRWRLGRRSFAQAESRGIGPIEFATRRRQVIVARAGGAEPLATVNHGRGGSVIHAVEGHALRWDKTARGNHWAMRDQDGTVLVIAASRGLLRSSVQISVERTMPEETAVLLCLIGCYLALSELQYNADLTAAAAAASTG